VSSVPTIHGLCTPRFAAVREALETNFREHGEVGAAVAVAVDGELVVDLWAGWVDAARTRPWQRDTLVNVFSVGKAVATVALLRLVERGLLGLDQPIARYWPEFARADKGAISVRMLLAHRAGLPAVRTPLPDDLIYDPRAMANALADETPWWEPGRLHGYHVNTFGLLVAELVQRVGGESIGSLVRREIAQPLDADFHFGLPAADHARVADCVPDELMGSGSQEGGPIDPERQLLLQRVYENPRGISGMQTVNTARWRSAVMPSTNGHTNARAVARVYSALACGGASGGVRLLERETLDEATGEASVGNDFVLRRPSRFGLGFQLWMPERQFSASPSSFGHFGAGGSLGFADPDARIGFGYVMNRSGPRWQNPRVRGLLDALAVATTGS
jgi:CubicO group peptidase (beta-lactamase class C family)